MTDSQRKKVEDLFTRAVELHVNERTQFLDENCPDPEIRSEVEKLLAYDNIEGGGLTDQFDDRHMPTKGMELSAPGRGDVSLPVSPSSSSSSSSIDHGRFLPGTVLSDRYRIVGMLGKGGMGEVYRADDLELGQSVALKFLPKKLAEDPRALERFRGEVRLARQVSHPNVCRVYDIGQINGQWFLSMEYVDGEDLAQLLTRIGRFPQERATELARQLCLGLHAAHEKGVLHRDLKPANIMIDGRGKLLITDFGLAEIADDVREDDIRSGTPAYMSPEQLAGREVTERSDIYSLGIILHEIYTGKPVWKADSMAELFEKRKSGTAPTPSSHGSDLDPVVESVIQRCLEPDPEKRPSTPLAVTAALPGGDPLAAALAAGETPSPQMVANSGGQSAVSVRVASIALLAVFVGLGLNVWLSGIAFSEGFESHTTAPAVLLDEAREIVIEELGYTEPPGESIHGFAALSEANATIPQFWYRQRPEGSNYNVNSFWSSIWGQFGWARPDFYQPNQNEPGEVNIVVSGQKRLLYLHATPKRLLMSGENVEPARWSNWFPPERTGYFLSSEKGELPGPEIDLEDIQVLEVVNDVWWPPLDAYDSLGVWRGQNDDGTTFLIEAAAFGGKPTYFRRIEEDATNSFSNSPHEKKSGFIAGLVLLLLIAAITLALFNLWTGRGDRVGARRLALYTLTLNFVVLLGLCRYSLSMEVVFGSLFNLGMSFVVLTAAHIWIWYLSLEPYVRRVWPQILISFSRVLDGRIQDPLVGKHILFGILFSVFSAMTQEGNVLTQRALSNETFFPVRNGMLALGGMRELIATTVHCHTDSLFLSMFTMMLLLVWRTVSRSEKIAIAGSFCTLVLMISAIIGGNFVLTAIWISIHVFLVLLVLVRFGFLSFIAFMTCFSLLMDIPMTYDASHWTFGYGMFGVMVIALIALYGFYTSIGGIMALKQIAK